MTVGRVRDSSTFMAGKRSEIGQYVVPMEVFLPGFCIGMINENFHVAGIWIVPEKLKKAVVYSMALGARCFKWNILTLSGPKAILLIQLLIVHLTRSVVNVCAISKEFLFVSLLIDRVSLEEVCLPSFDVLNRCLNLSASCLDDENKLPLNVIDSLSASRFYCHQFSTAWWHLSSGPRSQQNLSIYVFRVRRCSSGCHNSFFALQARWDVFYGGHLVWSSHPISLLV